MDLPIHRQGNRPCPHCGSTYTTLKNGKFVCVGCGNEIKSAADVYTSSDDFGVQQGIFRAFKGRFDVEAGGKESNQALELGKKAYKGYKRLIPAYVTNPKVVLRKCAEALEKLIPIYSEYCFLPERVFRETCSVLFRRYLVWLDKISTSNGRPGRFLSASQYENSVKDDTDNIIIERARTNVTPSYPELTNMMVKKLSVINGKIIPAFISLTGIVLGATLTPKEVCGHMMYLEDPFYFIASNDLKHGRYLDIVSAMKRKEIEILTSLLASATGVCTTTKYIYAHPQVNRLCYHFGIEALETDTMKYLKKYKPIKVLDYFSNMLQWSRISGVRFRFVNKNPELIALGSIIGVLGRSRNVTIFDNCTAGYWTSCSSNNISMKSDRSKFLSNIFSVYTALKTKVFDPPKAANVSTVNTEGHTDTGTWLESDDIINNYNLTIVEKSIEEAKKQVVEPVKQDNPSRGEIFDIIEQLSSGNHVVVDTPEVERTPMTIFGANQLSVVGWDIAGFLGYTREDLSKLTIAFR